MSNSEIISQVMFDWESIGDLRQLCSCLPNKLLRWLGANHPDNKTRKLFFEMTNVEIGEGTVINQHFIVSDDYLPLLKIGNKVAISPNVTIICASAPNNSELIQYPYVAEQLVCEKQVIVKDNVWIGTGVVILPGIEIGKNSIIGAGSVVTRCVESFSIYAGNPAKKIREL